MEIHLSWFVSGALVYSISTKIHELCFFKSSFYDFIRSLNNHFPKTYSIEPSQKNQDNTINDWTILIPSSWCWPCQDEEVFHCPSDLCEAKCREVRGFLLLWVDVLDSLVWVGRILTTWSVQEQRSGQISSRPFPAGNGHPKWWWKVRESPQNSGLGKVDSQGCGNGHPHRPILGNP